LNSPAQHSPDGMPTFFFHQRDFVFRNPESKIVSFLHDQLLIYFTHRDDELISLERSSFGGPVINGNFDLTDLSALLKKVTDWSLENKIFSIQVRCFPEAYDQPQSALIHKAFSLNGYEILYTDVDQILLLNADTGMDMNASRKWHVKKSRESGFQFRILDSIYLKRAYDLIADTRIRKGYSMSMSFPDLAEMFRIFPDHYFLFGVQHESKVIAGAVVIKVSATIWYCFYWGDDLDYRVHSPITYLVHELYSFAKDRGVVLLDLGTSSDKGVVNPGVFFFKKSLGCETTDRHTFIKKR